MRSGEEITATGRMKAYLRWIVRFIKFNKLTHPADMHKREVVAYLNWLANEPHVAASTQNQPWCAIVFLYKHILDIPLGDLKNLKRAKESKHLPVVLPHKEGKRILSPMDGQPKLMVELVYGGGLRQAEGLRLRVQDIDFEFNQVWVRNGKGRKDRTTVLPDVTKDKLKNQLKKVALLHKKDKKKGYGAAILPKALSSKYPQQVASLGWQYLFTASRRSKDPRSGLLHRHHLSDSFVQKAVKSAAQKVGL